MFLGWFRSFVNWHFSFSSSANRIPVNKWVKLLSNHLFCSGEDRKLWKGEEFWSNKAERDSQWGYKYSSSPLKVFTHGGACKSKYLQASIPLRFRVVYSWCPPVWALTPGWMVNVSRMLMAVSCSQTDASTINTILRPGGRVPHMRNRLTWRFSTCYVCIHGCLYRAYMPLL